MHGLVILNKALFGSCYVLVSNSASYVFVAHFMSSILVKNEMK